MAQKARSTYYEVFGGGTVHDEPGVLIYVAKDVKDFNEFRFYAGKPIEDWPEGITFFVKGQRQEDFLVLGLHWMIVSDRVRQVFEECRVDGVQFLPIRVVLKETGEELGSYWAINVVREVDALDWERTRWLHPERDHRTDKYARLDMLRVALRAEPLYGIDIFRLNIQGKGDSITYISEPLKRKLEEAGATSGFNLIPVKAY